MAAKISLHPGHPGGDDVHQGAGGVGGQAAGDVAAHPVQGAGQAAGQDAGLHFHGPHLPFPLGLVKFFDIARRHLQGRQHLRVHGPVSRLDLLRRGLQIRHGQIGLELPVLPDGFGVAVLAQGRDDRRHRGQHFAHVHLGAAQDRLPPGRVQFLQVFYLQTCHTQAPPFEKNFIQKNYIELFTEAQI